MRARMLAPVLATLLLAVAAHAGAAPDAKKLTALLKEFLAGAAVNDATLAEGPRLLSIATLAQIGEPTAIPQLQQCADADNSPTLKEAAANAIKALTGKPGAGAASAPPSGP